MLLRKFSKTLGIFWLILFAFNANATNYYLSNSGNDANSGTDPFAPWQTLTKLNSFKNLKPGDSVLFKRGDSFYGSITISNSGTASNPITFGAYGAGERPIITGFTKVTKWTNLGNNIWESTDAVSKLSSCNMVVINGVNTAMGRWPNGSYATFESHIGKTSITSSNLSGIPNWTGAEVVIRSTQWTLERRRISSQLANKLNYPALSYEPANGFGFFIQNDLRTLNQQNEWYYNPSTHKLAIYSISKPGNIGITSKDTLITLHGSFLGFSNLNLQGANQFAFYNDWSGIENIHIESSSISYSGVDAIKLAGTSDFTIINCKISNSNSDAINLFYLNPDANVSNNYIVNTGTIFGMGQSVSGSYTSIYSNDKRSIIRDNKIISSGYAGIFAIGDSFVIKNNYVDSFCLVLQDGGGIYTHSQQGINYGRKIIGNIVLNGIGAITGTNDSTYFAANGIYLDDNSAYIDVYGNSVANCSNNGLFIHNGYNLNVHDNTFYNCQAQFATQNDAGQYTLRGSTFNNNIFFSKTIKQFCGYFASTTNDFSLWGKASNNFYAKPISDSIVIKTRINWSDPYLLTLKGWKSYTGLDQNSNQSPKKITDTSDLLFEINPDSINKTIQLPYNYLDVSGKPYNGSISLAPYSSAILIKNGSITKPPNIDAGRDEIISLPQNSVKLSGSVSDSGKKVLVYTWTKIAGPAVYNITDSNSLVTDVTGLTGGVYLFKLTVADDMGATAKDTVTITVILPENSPPEADAGANKTIRLPVNTTLLAGSASDRDGSISSYLWEKISGPSEFKIEKPYSPVTNVFDLTQGTYEFQLSVLDNKGAIAKSTVIIIVASPLNIPPTPTAGANQTISLPLNTITLNGSGTDSDGIIAAYQWTQARGPNTAIISTPSSAATTVKGLLEGKYIFKLTVTDNEGATAADSIFLTLNPAPNTAPTPNTAPIANAGGDKTITLPINLVSLSGSGVDPDGSISSYLWTKISGPSAFTIANSSFSAITVSGLLQGVYLFELKVTDDKEAIGKDTVKVTVNAARNIAPTANAGADKTTTLPADSMELYGSGTDPDGTVVAYIWTQMSGPSTATITSSKSSSATVRGLIPGNYVFQLTVKDNEGETATDTVRINVNPASNLHPAANAGEDVTIVLPMNTIYLIGSGIDPDGTIIGYRWKEIGGLDSALIMSDNQSSTLVKNLVASTYVFELTVTDNNGEIGRDTIMVTVALPRISEEQNNNVTIYPNPVQDIATVEITAEKLNSKLTLIISDFSGKILDQQRLVSSDYKVTKKVDMRSFSKGNYAVTVFYDGESRIVKTMIKE